MDQRTRYSRRRFVWISTAATGLVAVACGQAPAPTVAPATTAPKPAASPAGAATAAPTTAPAAAATPAPTTAAAPKPATTPAAAAPAAGTPTTGAAGKPVTVHHASWAGPNGNQVHYVQRIIFDRLFDQAHDGQWVPTLAEKWTWAPGAASITFNLRKGVKFHDGTPFTAKDVVASVKAVAAPQTGGAFARLRPIKGVEAYGQGQAEEISGLKIVDDSTITFEFDRPAAGFFAYSAFGRDGLNILPAHIWDPQITKARKGEISLKEPQNPWYWSKEATVGTGAYRYAEGQAEKFIRLVPATDSWRGKATVPAILFQNFGAADTQALAFQKGELDVLAFDPTYEEQMSAMKEITIEPFVTPYIQILETNCLDTADPRARQAISSAINRDAINEGLYRKFHIPWPAVLQGEWNDEKAPRFPYDPAMSKKLLTESGFDTSRELVLAYDYPGQLPQQLMEAIQSDLQAVGFKTRLLHLQDAAAQDTRKAGKWSTWLNAYASHYSPYVLANAHRTDSVSDAGKCGTKELDDKFAQAETLADPAAQKKAWSEIQTTIQTQTSVIPLWRRGTKIAYQKRLGGWDKNTTAAFSMFGFHAFGAEKWSI